MKENEGHSESTEPQDDSKKGAPGLMIAIGLALGGGIGVALGAGIGHMIIGLPLGASVGLIIGILLETRRG